MLCPSVSQADGRLHDLGLVYRDHMPQTDSMTRFMYEQIVQAAIGTGSSVAVVLIPDVIGIDHHVSISA